MNNLITIDNDIRFGQPVLKGTRITVSEVLGYIAAGETIDNLLKNFPELTKEGILASIAYASDMLSVSTRISLNKNEIFAR